MCSQELARQTHREVVKLSRGSKIGACVLTKKIASAAIAAEGQGDVFRRRVSIVRGGGKMIMGMEGAILGRWEA